jgi:hypothetical protein
MGYLLLFLGGALLCNAIPHLAAGLRGEAFPTPFARPRGVANSSALMNFYWGTANLIIGICPFLVYSLHEYGIWPVIAGWLALGSFISWHFAKVRR